MYFLPYSEFFRILKYLKVSNPIYFRSEVTRVTSKYQLTSVYQSFDATNNEISDTINDEANVGIGQRIVPARKASVLYGDYIFEMKLILSRISRSVEATGTK